MGSSLLFKKDLLAKTQSSVFSLCQTRSHSNITTCYLKNQNNHAHLSLFSEYLTPFRADKFQVKKHTTCTTLINNIEVHAKSISMVGTGGSRNEVAEFRFFPFFTGFLLVPIAYFSSSFKTLL